MLPARLAHRATAFAGALLAGLAACSADPALVLNSPRNLQVFQRPGLDRPALLRVQGTVGVKCDRLRVHVTGKDRLGKEVSLTRESASAADATTFALELSVPPGGWYRCGVEALLGSETVAREKIDAFGVGEMFVIAGQSNATNWGSERQKPASGRVVCFDGATWRVADDPQPGVQDGSGGGSFIPAFGDVLAAKLAVPIGVVCVGAGATSVREWLPAGERFAQQPTTGAHVRSVGPGQWECTGELFEGLCRRVQPLGQNGFRAVLWHQGESDAGQARNGGPADRQISGQQYVQFMERLITASRQRLGWEVPWITAQATYHSEQDPADEEFRAAQKTLWDKELSLAGPDTDALRAGFRDGVHFNAKGLAAHGVLWAEKVGAWLAR